MTFDEWARARAVDMALNGLSATEVELTDEQVEELYNAEPAWDPKSPALYDIPTAEERGMDKLSRVFAEQINEEFGMKEQQIQRKIIEYLESTGHMVLKLSLNGYGQAGWPDLLVLELGGGCFFVEVKTDKGRTSKIQDARINQLRQHQHHVLVARSVEEVEAWLA
jgi:hypothetical protein